MFVFGLFLGLLIGMVLWLVAEALIQGSEKKSGKKRDPCTKKHQENSKKSMTESTEDTQNNL